MSFAYLKYSFGKQSKFWAKSLVSTVAKNKLTSVGSSGYPIATPSMSWYNLFLYKNMP